MASIPTQSVITFIQPRNDDTEQRIAWKLANLFYVGLGLSGVDQVADTASRAGSWWCFHALTACVVSVATYAAGTSTGTLAGASIAAGDRVYGQFIQFQLTSGTGELYRASMP